MRPTRGRYNVWAGNPKGTPEDPARCVEEVGYGDRGAQHHQCIRPRGHGEGGLYCKQHAGTGARHAARDAAYQRNREEARRIEEEGRTLLARLGVDGGVYYAALGKPSTHGYRRALVLSFEVVEQLLAVREAAQKGGAP